MDRRTWHLAYMLGIQGLGDRGGEREAALARAAQMGHGAPVKDPQASVGLHLLPPDGRAQNMLWGCTPFLMFPTLPALSPPTSHMLSKRTPFRGTSQGWPGAELRLTLPSQPRAPSLSSSPSLPLRPEEASQTASWRSLQELEVGVLAQVAGPE